MKSLFVPFFVVSVLLVGCGHKEDMQYHYTVNQCDTGEHKADSKEQYCSMLKDDALNNYCASDARTQERANQGCSG